MRECAKRRGRERRTNKARRERRERLTHTTLHDSTHTVSPPPVIVQRSVRRLPHRMRQAFIASLRLLLAATTTQLLEDAVHTALAHRQCCMHAQASMPLQHGQAQTPGVLLLMRWAWRLRRAAAVRELGLDAHIETDRRPVPQQRMAAGARQRMAAGACQQADKACRANLYVHACKLHAHCHTQAARHAVRSKPRCVHARLHAPAAARPLGMLVGVPAAGSSLIVVLQASLGGDGKCVTPHVIGRSVAVCVRLSARATCDNAATCRPAVRPPHYSCSLVRHAQSCTASQAAYCAGGSGCFWCMPPPRQPAGDQWRRWRTAMLGGLVARAGRSVAPS